MPGLRISQNAHLQYLPLKCAGPTPRFFCRRNAIMTLSPFLSGFGPVAFCSGKSKERSQPGNKKGNL
jgi:hypothetical protein